MKMMITLAQSIWKPEQASTVAAEVDWLFYFILYVSTFCVVLIAGLMVFFAIRFRRRDMSEVPEGPTHSTVLEITWSVIPTLVLLFIFVVGFRGYLDMVQPPSGAYEITVHSKKWAWTFEYPNGAMSEDLHVPAGIPVILTLTSDDVIHSLYVPAFRIKKDCVPGRYNKTWFETDFPDSKFGPATVTSIATGEETSYEDVAVFDLFCTEYCGTKHSWMRAHVIVHKTEGFRAWLKDAANQFEGLTPVEMGELLYKQRQCATCHSVDGSTIIGPSLKDVYGAPQQFSNAPPIDAADENYIRESIKNPNAKIVMGFAAGQMPPHNLPEQELNALVAWIKSISKHYSGDQLNPDVAEAAEKAEEAQEGETPGDPDDQPTSDSDYGVLESEQSEKAPGGMENSPKPLPSEEQQNEQAEGALQGPENQESE